MNKTKSHPLFPIPSRAGSNAVKWSLPTDHPQGLLPFWVADMDLLSPSVVQEALQKRCQHPIYGYTHLSQGFVQALRGWLSRRHEWTIDPSWIRFTPGVIPAFSAAIQAFTRAGDSVLYLSPAYPPFFEQIRRNGRKPLPLPLRQEGGTWRIPFEELKQMLEEQRPSLMLFCAPHNPCGRVWEGEELDALATCLQPHSTILVCDEIHNDLVLPPHRHVPFARRHPELDHRIVTLVAPSKTFNLAGLQSAAALLSDPGLMERFHETLLCNGLLHPSPFGQEAAVAAWTQGDSYVDGLNTLVAQNARTLGQALANLPTPLTMSEMEGTYLAWVDIRPLNRPSQTFCDSLRQETGVALESGTHFGPEGEGWVRWNLACSPDQLAQGLERFATWLGRS